ncbi:zinc-ribbon domain-containing protein [Paludisphaera mucosa]|uniref:Zinc-ribbon domain-containing protein n=1 Tax=Paludisphaera mucosa TaxID=3030827 RepID=A0ABT6FCA7_9BACT|nr:zinc-ribbon domain-containing protein [Paludisphaera mucosa]MDG3005228.1 zinc-ribbon domain-containing protein [Paludisphaera mucosa]
MIIECPHCGFSGRVPDHAALAPHQARCPKCRSRFDIGDPDVQVAEPVGRPDLRHDLTRPRLDPSDSSYELDPLGDGLGPLDSWDDAWDVDPEADPAHANGTLAAAAPAVDRRPSPWVYLALRPWVWRIRLFQAWAVIFLLAAAVILVRTALAVARFDDARFFSNELLRPIAAVVLLVSAAALLCLSVDVSRRLARSTYAPNSPPSPSPLPAPPSNGVVPPPRPAGTDLARRPNA